MRVLLTATISPPPHLLSSTGARQQRREIHCGLDEVGAEAGKLAAHAADLGLFDAGGMVSFLVQREPVRVNGGMNGGHGS